MAEHTSTTQAVDLGTVYMGLPLAHPFIAGASPLGARLDTIKQLEDGGAAAIVLHSLFEEQITEAASGRVHGIDRFEDPAMTLRIASYPQASDYPLSPDAYLEHVRRAKAATAIPIIASLNGMAAGSWLRHAALMQEAGADALEVNFYSVVTQLSRSAEAVEDGIVRAVEELKRTLRIPLAVKLPPFFSAFANMADRLSRAGADGLVLFNRFLQPDIDLDSISAVPTLTLSEPADLLLRLRWLAILSGRVRPSLAATGGVAQWQDGVKAILAGAHAVQMTSAVLRGGPAVFQAMSEGLRRWMTEHSVATVTAMRGRVSLQQSPDPSAFERAHYIRALHLK